MKQQIGVYLRLSLEDVDKKTNIIKDDSNSIASQRMLINRYLDRDPLLSDFPRMEFTDDGFSGTNFERPGFMKMIESVKHGEISCIAVKDLSRFGRDYLEVGDYLEHIFPFLGVRFISINDHYDSAAHSGRTIGMDVAFKNLIYDYYSKDLSHKVRSAMRMKQKEARYISCVPYGYKAHPAEKHQLVIDTDTAPVVRRIFEDIINGKSGTQIAKELNDEGILTPAQQKGIERKGASKKPQWTHRTVMNIIENIKYTGTMVNHTRESRFIRDKNQRHVPKEDWFIRENAHEAIVTREEYEKAQEAVRKRKKSPKTHHDKSDRVYYCAHCGTKLEKANGSIFACPSHRYHEKSACQHVRWKKSDLENVVFEALKRQITITGIESDAVRKKTEKNRDSLDRELSLLKAQYDTCGRETLSKYEEYREGKITADEYLEQKVIINNRQDRLKEQIDEAQKQYEAELQEIELMNDRNETINFMDGLPEKKLKEHLYDAVERIIVYDETHIEIVWKFNDVDNRQNTGAGA